MNPDDIELKNITKIFEYERMSRELDKCDNIEEMREKSKYVIKLYLATMEAYSSLGVEIKR